MLTNGICKKVLNLLSVTIHIQRNHFFEVLLLKMLSICIWQQTVRQLTRVWNWAHIFAVNICLIMYLYCLLCIYTWNTIKRVEGFAGANGGKHFFICIIKFISRLRRFRLDLTLDLRTRFLCITAIRTAPSHTRTHTHVHNNYSTCLQSTVTVKWL